MITEKTEVTNTDDERVKTLIKLADVYEKSAPELKETVGFTLKRNFQNFRAAVGKFN